VRGSMSEIQGELRGGGNTRWPFIGRKTLPAGERSRSRGGKRKGGERDAVGRKR